MGMGMGMARLLLGLAFPFVAGCAGEKAQQLPALPSYGKVTPVDEARRDPSLAAFRDSLLAIVGRRDSAALAARIAPTIRFSFGESAGGAAGFMRQWSASMDRLWPTLDDVLRHGGRIQDTVSFVAPWTFNALPDSLDAFDYLIIRDSGVVVYAAPDSASIGTLSLDIVRRGGGLSDSLWRSIRLPDDRMGFVEVKHVRSPVDYRIGFRKISGRWLIDFFVSGD